MRRTVFVALALTWLSAAAAQGDGSGGWSGGTGTNAPGISSDWLADSRLDLNVYGLSYHPDRNTIRRLGLDNEVNPGLGLNYELADHARGITFVQAGAYYDSGRNWAKFAALGYQLKLGERWRIGGALAVMRSRTYNGGAGFVAMIPLITYDLGRIKLNAVYLPKFGHYNKVDAFGFYLGIPFGRRAR